MMGRTKRSGGKLPAPVTVALDRLVEMGEPELARAALLALKPPKKRGGTVAISAEEGDVFAGMARRHLRENPDMTMRQTYLAIARSLGNSMSPWSVRRRIYRHCASLCMSIDDFETLAKDRHG
jgi:hypothetical protein